MRTRDFSAGSKGALRMKTVSSFDASDQARVCNPPQRPHARGAGTCELAGPFMVLRVARPRFTN